MSRLTKSFLIALVALLTLAPAASAQRRLVMAGAGYYGGGYYGGPGYYGPGLYGRGWYGPGNGYGQAAGSIKIVAATKGNSVYVDGGYAGLTGKLKKFQIRPGDHTIAFRDQDGRTFYQERIQVLMGKTIEVNPDASVPQNQD